MATLKRKTTKKENVTEVQNVIAETPKKVIRRKKTVEAKSTIEKPVISTEKKEQLDDANAVNITKKLTDKKDLMYDYPKDIDSLEKRKKHRTKVRAELRKIEKVLAKLKSSEDPIEMEMYNQKYKELETFRATYYTKEYRKTLV